MWLCDFKRGGRGRAKSAKENDNKNDEVSLSQQSKKEITSKEQKIYDSQENEKMKL